MFRRGPIQSSWAHDRATHKPDTGNQAAAVAASDAVDIAPILNNFENSKWLGLVPYPYAQVGAAD